jgi:serine/threonine-protein kinase RsbW
VTSHAVSLRFPAKPEYLLLARLAVAGVARSVPLAQEEVTDLKLAVTEACGNAVRHAYASGPLGEIELGLLPGPDRLELVVEDHGAGIELPLPEQEPSEAGGMGLSIIRAVVDELDVAPRPDGGTIVHMTKLAGRRPGGERRHEQDARGEV